MTKSKAVRDRENRQDTSGRHLEPVCGAMVSITTYRGTVRMFEVRAVAPGTAGLAGRLANGLLPKSVEEVA